MSAPLVSVITVCHNYGRYLAECCNSVQAQTFRDFEHVVVNAASTDDTATVAASLEAYHSVRVIHLEDDPGLCESRNLAVKQSAGRYIVNLDADDKIHPRFLERLVAEMAPQIIACPGLQEFGMRSNAGWPSLPIGLPELLNGNRIFCCSMFSREDFDAVGGYDPTLSRTSCEDWELWCALVKAGCQVKIVPELLFLYRVHAQSRTADHCKFDPQSWDYIRRKHSSNENPLSH